MRSGGPGSRSRTANSQVVDNTPVPDGLVFYETFTIDHLKHSSFKREWVLEYNELLREFSGLRILRYQEIDRDGKAVASIVAQKQDNKKRDDLV